MNRDFPARTERDIIEHIAAVVGPITNPDIVQSIGDDCAVLRKDDENCFLVTTDTLVGSVHFDLAWHPPRLLGRKAAAVNLSDIAAMGGRPRFGFLSTAFPGRAPGWLDEFLTGFGEMLQSYDTFLVGGDTVKSSEDICINVTIIGEARRDSICYRSGARFGDLVCVTGLLGEAAAGLALCSTGRHEGCPDSWQGLIRAHLDPQPQVGLGRMLAASGMVHAMIDISDGLATDLAHMCRASGTGAEINRKNLPVSGELDAAAASFGKSSLDWVLKGGEDYQLLFTVAADQEQDLRRLVTEQLQKEFFTIGRIQEVPGVFLADNETVTEISYQGYEHFTDGPGSDGK